MAKKNKKDDLNGKKNSKKEVKNDKKVNKSNVNKITRKVKHKSYADETKISLNSEIKKTIWTCVVVLLVLGVFYIISVKATGNSLFKKDEKNEVSFQYTEILAGSSFDMGDNYYVVYYDMSDYENDETTELTNSISNFRNKFPDINIYTCDLGNAFNKPLVTTNEPNTKPIDAEDLLLNGPTIIKFSNGSVEEYIYGFNDVQTYIDSFSDVE